MIVRPFQALKMASKFKGKNRSDKSRNWRQAMTFDERTNRGSMMTMLPEAKENRKQKPEQNEIRYINITQGEEKITFSVVYMSLRIQQRHTIVLLTLQDEAHHSSPIPLIVPSPSRVR